MIQIGDTANLTEFQIRPNLWALTGLPEDSFEYVDQNETFEIWRVKLCVSSASSSKKNS